MTEAEATAVEDAARLLKTLSETFRTLEYAEIMPAVAVVLMRLSAVDAVLATREFGLRVPNSRRACIEHISRAIAERKESWERIGLAEKPADETPVEAVNVGVTTNVPAPARKYVSTERYHRQHRAPGAREGTGRKRRPEPNDCPECARSFGPHYRGPCEHA